MMRYLFVINPKAGDGSRVAKIQEEIALLPEKESCEVYLSRGRGDVTRYVREYLSACPEEEVRVIACGGDGTLNEAVNGAAGFGNASLTVYPCGSGNDFVKALGGAERFRNVAALVRAPSHPIDLMKASGLYSINVINFGFDTTVAITVNELRDKKGTSSKNSYTKGIIKALATSMRNTALVSADGKALNPSGKFLLCTLANGQYVGGSFRCAPRSNMADGLIDVCLVDPISRVRFIKIIKVYTEGRHLDDPTVQDVVHYARAKKIEIKAPKGFAYSLDGEIIYDNDFTVEIVPGALNLAVPE